MTDIRDEPAEDKKKIRKECGQSESRWGELQVNETALLLNNEWRRPLQTYCWLEEGVILWQWRQDRQCTYNVTLRRFPALFVAVEKQWISHNLSMCICSLRYPPCNVHVPYCQLWLALLYNSFPPYLLNGTVFEKKIYWTQKVCFDFLYNFFSETFLILRRNERDVMKIYVGLHIEYSLFLFDLNENCMCSTDFSKNPQLSWKSV